MHTNHFAILLMIILLAGCINNKDIEDLHAYVTEVTSLPTGQIKPLPKFNPYESFQYSAVGLRAPFSIPGNIHVKKNEKPRVESSIKPDLKRSREDLEKFDIEVISMVGTFTFLGGDMWALLNVDGDLYRVTAGNYIGRNHGLIIAIGANMVDIIEIVPDGGGRWLERPRAVKLKSGAESI